jgi:hypothetical protein
MARLEPSIGLRVMHRRCEGHQYRNAYSFLAPASFEELVSWINHLAQKTWMGKEDILRLLNLRWTHKGERAPNL